MGSSASRPDHRQSSLRRYGALAAIAIAAVFVVLLGGLMLRSALNDDAPPVDAAPEMEPLEPAEYGRTAQPGLGGPLKGVKLDLLDRTRPDRKIGELMLGTMEPVGERRYAVENPEALVFLDSGSTVHIRADRGNMYMPDAGREPESGRLYGDVTVRVYMPGADGGKPQIEVDEPRAIVRTESLHFDLALSELSTSEEVTVRMPELDGHVIGLRVIVSESLQQLEQLEMVSNGIVHMRPGAAPPRTKPARPAPGTEPRALPPAEGRPPRPAVDVLPPPPERFYAATFRDSVMVLHAGQQITADALDASLRLIDGTLPEDAIAPVRIRGGASAMEKERGTDAAAPRASAIAEGRELREPASASKPADAAQPSAGARSTPAVEEDEPITLSWTGPAAITLIDRQPAELARDHVALRFTADEGSEVVFSDEQSGAEARMTDLDYLATTRRMTFTHPEEAGAVVRLPGAGQLAGSRIESNLGSGFIQIVGPGVLSPEGNETHGRAMSIRARDRSAFVLKVEDGVLLSELQQAVFEGDVHLASDDGIATAGFARADFVTTPRRGNNLVRLVLDDDAQMKMHSGEHLRGDRIDTTFRPGEGGGHPEPARLTAIGGVEMQREDERVEAAFLEAELGRDQRGRTEVVRALIRGQDAVIARGEGDAQSRISGAEIRLDGRGRTLEVLGAGRFDHSDGDARIEAAWQRSMMFDDLGGLIVAEGNATAESRPDPHTIDRAAGERITLRLTPGGGASARDLVRAAIEGPDDGRAHFESRTYADVDGRELEQVRYLEASRIIADNERGELRVPVAGRMLLVDRRDDNHEPARRQNGPGFGPAGRGSTLADWDGSLRIDRRSGRIEIQRKVHITHKPDDGEVINLSCDELVAQAAVGDDEPGTQLRSATARGSVRITSGTGNAMQELSADITHYDARTGIIQALAEEGNVVTVLDPAAASPMTARALIWNTITDDVRIVEPGQIVIPH